MVFQAFKGPFFSLIREASGYIKFEMPIKYPSKDDNGQLDTYSGQELDRYPGWSFNTGNHSHQKYLVGELLEMEARSMLSLSYIPLPIYFSDTRH